MYLAASFTAMQILDIQHRFERKKMVLNLMYLSMHFIIWNFSYNDIIHATKSTYNGVINFLMEKTPNSQKTGLPLFGSQGGKVSWPL